jgi:hypothetical protein
MSLIAAAITSFAGAWLLAQRPAAGGDAERTSELEALVRRADFDAAETTAQKLLRTGTLSRGEVAHVYLQLGIVASAKRDSAGAAAAFRKAVCLDGELRLSPSAGPHVAEAFGRAKAAMPAPACDAPKVVLTASAATGELSVEAPARRAGDDLGRSVAVTIGDAREARGLGPAPLRFAVELPTSVSRCATATAGVLDEFGNELWAAVASVEVCRAPLAAPAPPSAVAGPAPALAAPTAKGQTVDVLTGGSSPPPKPISRTTWVATAMTGAAAVGTAVLGLVALERRDDYNGSFGGTATLDQQRQLRELAVTAEHRATAGGIVTALLATATVVLYVKGRF